MNPQNKVTLEDIANRVGVSAPAVSQALSGKGRISPETWSESCRWWKNWLTSQMLMLRTWRGALPARRRVSASPTLEVNKFPRLVYSSSTMFPTWWRYCGWRSSSAMKKVLISEVTGDYRKLLPKYSKKSSTAFTTKSFRPHRARISLTESLKHCPKSRMLAPLARE